MNEDDFKKALQGKKIPILVLDQKWHRLFAIHGKTDEIKSLEKEVTDLLAEQGRLNQELKSLKKVKSDRMDNVMANMDDSDPGIDRSAREKSLETDKNLLDQINERMDQTEDRLLEIPKEIDAANEALMLASMDYCYAKLRVNKDEAEEIEAWIRQVRVDLKRNIIKKQNREINNKEIYAYLHDIFGAEIMEIFDIKEESRIEGNEDES